MYLLRAMTTHVLTLPTSPVSSITTYITVIGTTIYSGSRMGPQVLVPFADATDECTKFVSRVDGDVTDQVDSARNVILSVRGRTLESLVGLSCSTNMIGLRHGYVTITRFFVSGLLNIIINSSLDSIVDTDSTV